jgi:hypothetical protein
MDVAAPDEDVAGVLRYEDAIGLGALLRMPVLYGTLGLLLALDLLFLGLHATHVVAEWQGGGRFADRRWSVETEGGAAELWEVGKTGLCVAALADAARRAGQPVYAALAFGFGLALVDTLFALHERGGAWLAGGLVEAGRLFEAAPQALGETLVFALDALLIGAALWAGCRRSARRHWPLAAAMALLMALDRQLAVRAVPQRA